MACRTPFERLWSYLFSKTALGFLLVGIGVGTMLVLFVPLRFWLILFAIASIGYGIYCIKDFFF